MHTYNLTTKNRQRFEITSIIAATFETEDFEQVSNKYGNKDFPTL